MVSHTDPKIGKIQCVQVGFEPTTFWLLASLLYQLSYQTTDSSEVKLLIHLCDRAIVLRVPLPIMFSWTT